MKARDVKACPYYENASRRARTLVLLVLDTAASKRGRLGEKEIAELCDHVMRAQCDAWETGLIEGHTSRRRRG